MDPRRRLILALLALLPVACAEAPRPRLAAPVAIVTPVLRPAIRPVVLTEIGPPRLVGICRRSNRRKGHHSRPCRMSLRSAAEPAFAIAPTIPIITTPLVVAAVRSVPRATRPVAPMAPTPVGPRDRMDGAIEVFAYAPGRLFPVRTAPLRVTTLTLEPGETLIDKAAGDTVRWEIGDTTSGSGDAARTLVMLKPLAAGLSTNLVLTTSRRVYLLDLSSTARHADTDIAWSYASAPVRSATAPAMPTAVTPAAPMLLGGQVSGRYRIDPVGRRPSWMPAAVFDDGRRTFIAFGPDLAAHPAPLLFVDGPDGRPALVNYRQAGDLYIVDALFSRAELKLGDRPAQVVRLVKLDGAAS